MKDRLTRMIACLDAPRSRRRYSFLFPPTLRVSNTLELLCQHPSACGNSQACAFDVQEVTSARSCALNQPDIRAIGGRNIPVPPTAQPKRVLHCGIQAALHACRILLAKFASLAAQHRATALKHDPQPCRRTAGWVRMALGCPAGQRDGRAGCSPDAGTVGNRPRWAPLAAHSPCRRHPNKPSLRHVRYDSPDR